MTQKSLSKLGADISLARRARKIAVADFAERAGISRATLYRLENGDAGVSLNTLAMALQVLGRLDLLTNLIDASHDDVGLMVMRGQVPKRVSRHKARDPEGGSEPSSDVMEW
jgi:transcriptional regulator with XRE-family HTH domain